MIITNGYRLVFLLVIGLVACNEPESSNPPTELVIENLLRQQLADEFIPDREVVVSHVEIPPNTTMDRHWHPGEEFHYYLEGKVEIVIDGETTIIGTPGTVGFVPFKKMHTAITGEEGAKFIVFRVHTTGEPVRFLEDGGSAKE